MIDMNKKYRYRNGRPARILCVDGYDNHEPVVSMDGGGRTYTHTINGAYQSTYESYLDLIEVSPYEGIPIDTPGEGWSNTVQHNIQKGHFGGTLSDGSPTMWFEGRTSWTEAVRVRFDNFSPAVIGAVAHHYRSQIKKDEQ